MKAIILAGGLGSRLKPFTQVIPKPLLPIGESTVLEIQIMGLEKFGVKDIFIATNYMSKYVEAFLGVDKKYGVKIHFSKEKIPLGTCGPVRLLKDKLTAPFFLINGDILTKLDFKKAYDYALKTDADLTVVTKEIITPFNFGRVTTEGDYLKNIQEKPDFKLEILAGIYVLKPPVINLIPENTNYGMDTLIKDMLKRNLKVGRYLMKEYWLDIGRMDDYSAAQDDYKKHFNKSKTK